MGVITFILLVKSFIDIIKNDKKMREKYRYKSDDEEPPLGI